ncbi:MAG TPA: sigma-70 family RNA polymerase sigma factor [Pirellulaceae bacterium]|nr:sigma-70 family RNA polymerase sigma factor [Pirellulaceae bacterium]
MPELLGRLLDEHGGALVLYASQWTETPDDCVQEALIELVKQPILPHSPVAWLFRVVRNRAISQARAAGRRKKHERHAAALLPAWSQPAEEPPFSEQELAAAIDMLLPEHREVLVARVWGGLGFEEIAELVGAATSSAHRRYEAALANLRQVLRASVQRRAATGQHFPNARK